MFSVEQLIAHVIGDYVLQSDYMALKKRTDSEVCAIHAGAYTLPFVFMFPSSSYLAVLFITLTHFVIDHFALARFICFAKNFLAPRQYWPCWEDCKAIGYAKDRPVWLVTWLYVIVDNTMHVCCNAIALRYL